MDLGTGRIANELREESISPLSSYEIVSKIIMKFKLKVEVVKPYRFDKGNFFDSDQLSFILSTEVTDDITVTESAKSIELESRHCNWPINGIETTETTFVKVSSGTFQAAYNMVNPKFQNYLNEILPVHNCARRWKAVALWSKFKTYKKYARRDIKLCLEKYLNLKEHKVSVNFFDRGYHTRIDKGLLNSVRQFWPSQEYIIYHHENIETPVSPMQTIKDYVKKEKFIN